MVSMRVRTGSGRSLFAKAVRLSSCVAIAWVPLVGSAQASRLLHRLAQREVRLSGLTRTYHLDKWIQQDRTNLPQQLGGGVRAARQYTWHGDWTVERGSGLTIIHGQYPVLYPKGGTQTRRGIWFFGNRFQGSIRHGNDGRPALAVLTRTGAEGERAEVALETPAILSTTGLFFLAGASPEHLFGLLCVVTSEAEGKVHFANYGGVAPNFKVTRFTIPVDRNFTFDVTTLAPKSEEMLQYRQADWDYRVWLPTPFEQWVVRKTTTYEGIVLPKTISNIKWRPNKDYPVASKTSFTLTGVRRTTRHLTIPIPIGFEVQDYRLDAVDLMFGEFPGGAKPVTYTWTGHLPSLEELRGMRGAVR